jgi:hypothetical protein
VSCRLSAVGSLTFDQIKLSKDVSLLRVVRWHSFLVGCQGRQSRQGLRQQLLNGLRADVQQIGLLRQCRISKSCCAGVCKCAGLSSVAVNVRLSLLPKVREKCNLGNRLHSLYKGKPNACVSQLCRWLTPVACAQPRELWRRLHGDAVVATDDRLDRLGDSVEECRKMRMRVSGLLPAERPPAARW